MRSCGIFRLPACEQEPFAGQDRRSSCCFSLFLGAFSVCNASAGRFTEKCALLSRILPVQKAKHAIRGNIAPAIDAKKPVRIVSQPALATKKGDFLRSPRIFWWSWGELNSRPLECHSSALPTELQPLRTRWILPKTAHFVNEKFFASPKNFFWKESPFDSAGYFSAASFAMTLPLASSALASTSSATA